MLPYNEAKWQFLKSYFLVYNVYSLTMVTGSTGWVGAEHYTFRHMTLNFEVDTSPLSNLSVLCLCLCDIYHLHS